MKQMNTTEVRVGEHDFIIKPFPAFAAARLIGDLASLIAPLIGVASAVSGQGNLMDMELTAAAPMIVQTFNQIDGDKIEGLLKILLINDSNIIVKVGKDGEVLTEDIADDIFCTDIQDMFLLAFEVIKVNYNGFFKRAGSLSGKVGEAAGRVRTIL